MSFVFTTHVSSEVSDVWYVYQSNYGQAQQDTAGAVRIMKEVYCRRCGERLTSPRTIKWQEGQRCRWKRQEAEGTRVYRGPHMKEDVPFKPMGTKVQSGVIVMHVQTQLGDWE